MNVFLTGGTGYIGGVLLQKLLEQGDEVHALCRKPDAKELLRHERLTWIKGTLDDPSALDAGMAGCEGVYHAAAYARVWSKAPECYHRTNIAGTLNVVEAANRSGIRKMVITSTAGVTGAGGKTPVDETYVRSDGFQNEYEATKAIAEIEALNFAGENLMVTIVRPARVYGPGKVSRSNPFSFLIRTLQKAPVFLLPEGSDAIGSYCFLDDVVNGHILAMKNGGHGQRYLLGGENLSYDEVITETMRACQRTIRILPIPFSLFKFYSRIELLRGKLSDYEPRIVPQWAERFRRDAALSSRKAETELGYTITPFAIGIRKTIDSLENKVAV